MQRRHRIWLVVLGVTMLIPIVTIGGWTLTETAIQATSDHAFCTSCHVMEPFALAYDADVHGGQNAGGLVAHCVDCHLPHETPGGYLLAKIQTGVHDLMSQMLLVFREPDWIGNLERRAEYVFDSGCLNCHANLREAPNPNPAVVFAHRAYFQEGSNLVCVTCHAHVGHKDLLAHLTGTVTRDGIRIDDDRQGDGEQANLEPGRMVQ
ncbi:hypothetical protein CKO25_16885 [Thiocapsa imhoffii]|uniref:NapC/NirT cytochrome c N-terminal domain-containing protein n=1 Tax=Thiocapsa imhoffii TaxID=382777 RepID=A0A9X0WKA2_9GAMM|nr:NapC/NirT family cytochrome c [Thiocapsa imhoffii]MBK1646291.1 hypothetical protein [Thiocapsa imhoffii]